VKISEHFTIEELTDSDYAARHGISNAPTQDMHENLVALAQGLERVRRVLGQPMHITSGYRSPKVNAGAGGAKDSYHMKGLAADFKVAGMTPYEVCSVIEAHKVEIQYDKQILEFGAWTHIQFPDGDAAPRLASYTIKNKATGYQGGIIA
jgi:zinc D-Ala-D-Ala carboxypeptidase